MAAINVPIIEDKALPTTPAHEWASETHSALGTGQPPAAEELPTPTTFPSAVSTPGPELPGAYHRGPDDRGVSQTRTDPLAMLNSAKGYLPDVNTARQYLPDASTAKQYLPAAVVSYFPSMANDSAKPIEQSEPQLPPQESDDLDINRDALKANDSTKPIEQSEPQLPPQASDDLDTKLDALKVTEESFGSESSAPAAERQPPTDAAKSLGSESNLESAVAMKRDTKFDGLKPPTRGDSAFTEPESISALSTQAVVDSSESETTTSTTESTPLVTPKDTVPAPAVIPAPPVKELDRPDAVTMDTPHQYIAGDRDAKTSSIEPSIQTTPQTHHLGGKGAALRGVPVNMEFNNDMKPITSNPISKQAFEGVTSPGVTSPGQDSTTAVTGHDAPTPSATTEPDVPPAVPSKFTELETPSSTASQNTTSTNSSGSGSPRGSKFLNKIKGEVKVISGKIGKNEEKVEEGRRLLGKAQ